MAEQKTFDNILPTFMAMAIEDAIAKVTEEELEKAKERIDQRKAEVIAGVTLFIYKQIKIDRVGQDLTITIRSV